jgi:hypothetical protein
MVSSKAGNFVPQMCDSRSRFETVSLPLKIEDVNAISQPLPGGYADVTRGGGMTFERVVFLGPGGTSRAELHLKKGHVKKLEQFRLAFPRRSANQDMPTFKLRTLPPLNVRFCTNRVVTPATGKRQPRKLAPAGKPETLPGPFAHLGRVTGMEKPGALAETGIWKMVLNRARSLSVFMQMVHSWMLHCGILIAPAYTHLAVIEAGHLARLEMENSDEKPVPCRFRRLEPERSRCSRCQRRRFP